jgi:hypothetical protein
MEKPILSSLRIHAAEYREPSAAAKGVTLPPGVKIQDILPKDTTDSKAYQQAYMAAGQRLGVAFTRSGPDGHSGPEPLTPDDAITRLRQLHTRLVDAQWPSCWLDAQALGQAIEALASQVQAYESIWLPEGGAR